MSEHIFHEAAKRAMDNVPEAEAVAKRRCRVLEVENDMLHIELAAERKRNKLLMALLANPQPEKPR